MSTLASLVAAYNRTPTATVLLGGQVCRAVISLKTSQSFGSGISTGTIVLRDPPVTPTIGTTVSWRWGYNGHETPGFTGEIARPARKSYPNRYTIECRDVLWRADRVQQVIATSPLNTITASAAVRYILTHYGGISSSRISLPTFSASGSAWGGSEWTLGILTPVQWGDTDTNTGGTSALKAAQEICSCLGYWLYADASGIIRAKQMDRAPSLSAVHTFQRGVDLLTNGNPELTEDVDAIRNRIIVLGGNTGVDGAQITDTYQTSHPLLPSGVYQEDTFSSFLLEYENATDAGVASVTETAKRILKVRSRPPVIVRHRVKADPRLSVGATVGITDSAIGYTTARNFFIYELETSADYQSGDFSQQMTLDGGTGNAGYTTIPPPDASFSWRLVAETLTADAVVEVFLDGSGSTSLTGGEIVSWAWSTSTTTYSATPNSATGETAVLLFLASEGTADITLTVTDTTSKTGTITQTIDLTGADTAPPIARVLGVAFGAAWAITPDGGETWNAETSNGDAIAVGTIGAGADARAAGTAGTYGMVATRGTGGTGLRQTLDTLGTASTNLVAAGGAITSNIWVNEANPARIWFAVGTAVYRSTDGGVTKTAMHAAAATVHWIMEDPVVDNSIFLLAGANMYNATDPTVGYALLYAGPGGSTARQFVRSRDGQVTWVCYTGAPSGEALQRVETGALADLAVTDIQTLALNNAATSLLATLWAATADNPAQIWSFDGLTGLSAAQSTPTFPTGATVQHCLYDPEVDLIYFADFDSVAVGTGAVRKFLADQLFLYKAGAVGQQAHMLGFGAKASAPAEFVWINADTNPITAYHYKDGLWTARPLPVSASGSGVWITADPFNPSRWLAVVNGNGGSITVHDASGQINGASWAHSPLWGTDDAGVTWTEIPIPTPALWNGGGTYHMQRATFNDQTGNRWSAVISRIDDYYTAVISGSSQTITDVKEITTYSSPGIVSGAEGETVLTDVFNAPNFNLDYLEYLDVGGTSHRAAGTSPGNLYPQADRLPALSRAVLVVGFDAGDLFLTTDYRAAQPSATSLTANVTSVACGSVCTYYLKSGDLYRLVDPLGAFTSTLINNVATFNTEPRVDRQTRTRMGIGLAGGGGESVVLSDDGSAAVSIAGPPVAASTMSPAFETVVRS